jgi:ubiquinone/menaquinone biosynthesis C-methylase UbiE
MNKSPIHSTANSYQNSSEIYESGRPGYTEESVFALCEHLSLTVSSSIVELGAGTGKFTRILAKKYPNVLVVEPVPAMLEKLKSILPEVRGKLGTGEDIPSQDLSADAIIIANAFHWFSTEKAINEFKRVLKNGGGLGLIWNLDGVFTSAWGKIIDSWLDEIEGETPQYKTGLWRKVLEKSEFFSPLSEQHFSSSRATTPEEIIDRVMSISFVAAQPDSVKVDLQQRIEKLLATHPETQGKDNLTVTFDTKIYWCFRK